MSQQKCHVFRHHVDALLACGSQRIQLSGLGARNTPAQRRQESKTLSSQQGRLRPHRQPSLDGPGALCRVRLTASCRARPWPAWVAAGQPVCPASSRHGLETLLGLGTHPLCLASSPERSSVCGGPQPGGCKDPAGVSGKVQLPWTNPRDHSALLP